MKVVFFESIHNTQDYALENFEARTPTCELAISKKKGEVQIIRTGKMPTKLWLVH